MKTELINESVILLTVYFLLMFSGEFVTDGEAHNDIGKYMIRLTIVSFAITGLFILSQLKAPLRRAYLKCVLAEKIAKREAEKEKQLALDKENNKISVKAKNLPTSSTITMTKNQHIESTIIQVKT